MISGKVELEDVEHYLLVNRRMIDAIKDRRQNKGMNIHVARDAFLAAEGCTTVNQYFAKHKVKVAYRSEVIGSSYYIPFDYEKIVKSIGEGNAKI